MEGMAPALGRQLAALMAPPRCGGCGAGCEAAEPLCERCSAELGASAPVVEPGPPGVELAVAAARFEGAARAVAHGLKYGRRLALAEVAARAMLGARTSGLAGGILVPVPAAPWRRRWRGFDPAEEIALALARIGGLPYLACLRRGGGPRQVGRPRSDRLADPPRIWLDGSAPIHAVLVDDVHTTGATLAACAAALRAGGCLRIEALTLARAP